MGSGNVGVRSGSSTATVTVVVPTLGEAENLAQLVERLGAVRASSGLDLELLLMDDGSRDGSEELVRGLALPWVRMIVRTGARGLAQAVLDGMRRSTRDVVVVMDADLSHPPERIPDLVRALEDGADLVVGSRFAQGGSTGDRGVLRRLGSRAAALLALPLARIRDPLSGFFALRTSTFAAGRDLDPVGHEIGLELAVKCPIRRAVELPVHFGRRRAGRSKRSFVEQLRYLQHLRRLYTHRYGTWSHLVQFLAVGASGLVVNLAILTVLLKLSVEESIAIAAAIALSIVWNFALNRRFSFSYARQGSMIRQFGWFVSTCAVGAVVNYLVTRAVWDAFRVKQVAASIGVVAGTLFNFFGSRYVAFRRARPPAGAGTGAASPPPTPGPPPRAAP